MLATRGFRRRRIAGVSLAVLGPAVAPAFAEDLLVCAFNSDQIAAFCVRDGRFIENLPGGGTTFGGPQGITVGPDGLWYICSENTDQVLRYDPDSWEFIDVFIGDDPGTVENETGGLDGPTAAIFGPDGDLYVASFETDSVLKYSGSTGAYLGVFVAAGAGGLNGPDSGLMFDANGDLLIPSFFGNAVLRFSGVDGAPMTPFVASLNRPRMLLPRPDVGDILISAEGAGQVRRYDAATGAALGIFAALSNCTGLARDAQGNVYVGKINTHVVRKYSSTGTDLGVFVPAQSNGINGPVFLFMSPSRRCQGDITGDGVIDLDDLLLVLGNFGECGGEPNYPALTDVDNDGCIDLDDLLEILGGFDG